MCHEDVLEVESIRRCSCKKLARARLDHITENVGSKPGGWELAGTEEEERKVMSVKREKEEGARVEGKEMRYDSTGLYHWCVERELDSVLLTRPEVGEQELKGHLVVAVFSDPESPPLGLRNLIMPLRASNIPFSQLRDVVILGSRNFIEKYVTDITSLGTLQKHGGYLYLL